MQEIINRINKSHQKMKEELIRHEEFMAEQKAKFNERSRNIRRMIDEISSDLDKMLEGDN